MLSVSLLVFTLFDDILTFLQFSSIFSQVLHMLKLNTAPILNLQPIRGKKYGRDKHKIYMISWFNRAEGFERWV